MKLKSTIQIFAASPAGTTAKGSKQLPDDVGHNSAPRNPKKYKVIDSRYGIFVSSWDNWADAEKAAQARPWSKVIVGKIPGQYGSGQKKRKFKGDI